MRVWIQAILLVGLAAMLAIRQSTRLNESKTLRQNNEENLARYQELVERLQRLEQVLSPTPMPARFDAQDPSKPQFADTSEILQRLQALEQEVARIQAK